MIRFFGSSAPGSGAGPAGQLAALRFPARIAAAKLIASFLLRLATSLGTALSPTAGLAAASLGIAATGGVEVAAEGVLAVASGMRVAAAESTADAAPVSTGFGV